MPIRQPGPGQMNKRGLPSAYQQFETAPAPSLRDQAVTAVKDRLVQGFTEPIKRTIAPLYGGPQPSMEDVTQATASMLPVGGLRVGGRVGKPALVFAVRDSKGKVLSDVKATTHAQVILNKAANPDEIIDSGFIFKGEYKPGNPVWDAKGNITDVVASPMPAWMKETPEGKAIMAQKGFTGITDAENAMVEQARTLYTSNMQPAQRLREAKE